MTDAPGPSPVLAAVVLDFDGLIVDTETPVFEAWRETYAEFGQSLGLDAWQRALGTHRGFDPCTHLEELLGRPVDCETIRAQTRARNRAHRELLPLLPGVETLLDAAIALGLRRGVASSSSRGWVSGWLERHGLSSRIEVVCGRDDVARVKPEPELFLLAARRLGVAPAQTLVFEDSPNGLLAARAAGMRAVLVPGPVTRPLEFPDHDARFESLADVDLVALAARLGLSIGAAVAPSRGA